MDLVVMGNFVPEKMVCCTVKTPHVLGAFYILLAPFLCLYHAMAQPGGPH